jgi:hypothetical protein
MDIIKNYHDKKWTLQFLDALYNSIDIHLVNNSIYFLLLMHPSIKGNVRLILYPEVVTVYSDKQFIENEWKRLSTKPEQRVTRPSEFAFAFETTEFVGTRY